MSLGAPGTLETGSLSPADLAELVGAFNEVTARLQSTHEQLRSEVGRLQSELKDTRNQLRRARELAALGEMAAGIAHEVRNPLVSIRLFGEALVADLSDRPAEQELAGKIVRSVDRLNAVVGDVLNFSRDLRVQAESVSVAAFLHDVQEAAAGHAASLGVELAVLDCDGLTFCVDRGLMLQALLNVLRNACEAAGEDAGGRGRVGVRVEPRRGRTAEGASRDELAIRSSRRARPALGWVWRSCTGSSMRTAAAWRSVIGTGAGLWLNFVCRWSLKATVRPVSVCSTVMMLGP